MFPIVWLWMVPFQSPDPLKHGESPPSKNYVSGYIPVASSIVGKGALQQKKWRRFAKLVPDTVHDWSPATGSYH